MRITILLIVAAAGLLLGCKDKLSPTQVIGAFVEAVGSGHPDKTASLINKESQIMVTTNLISRQGIAWIAAQASRSKDGDSYQLVLDKSMAKVAVVMLEGAYADTPPFIESGFPPQLRKQGVKFYLVREFGKWKIDLIRSENELFDVGLEYLCSVNKGVLPAVYPPWMPTPIGMPPNPPGMDLGADR